MAISGPEGEGDKAASGTRVWKVAVRELGRAGRLEAPDGVPLEELLAPFVLLLVLLLLALKLLLLMWFRLKLDECSSLPEDRDEAPCLCLPPDSVPVPEP